MAREGMIASAQKIVEGFYSHQRLNDLEEVESCVTLCNLLLDTKISDIINIVKNGQQHRVLTSANIPQFSNLDDVFDSVPEILAHFDGAEGIGYSRMGYFLRKGQPRKEIADKKYGENHLKCAELLGLCQIQNREAKINKLGKLYISLNSESKKRLRPRLCLYVYMIQLYFCIIDDYPTTDEALLSLMSFLSKSTQLRRLPNCRSLVRLVKEEIEYEL